MGIGIDYKKIFKEPYTLDEKIEYYYYAYIMEKDGNKKLIILKYLEKLLEEKNKNGKN